MVFNSICIRRGASQGRPLPRQSLSLKPLNPKAGVVEQLNKVRAALAKAGGPSPAQTQAGRPELQITYLGLVKSGRNKGI